MNKNMLKQRISIEMNQIHSILNDFRKTKLKCLELANIINAQIPNQEYFKTIEKNTVRKMDLLDLPGLVNLKNQLVKALTDLFEIERQLRYKKEKYVAKMQIMNTEVQESNNIKKRQVESTIQSTSSPSNLSMSRNFRNIVTESKKDEASVQEQKPKNRNLQIPLYRAKNETNENKLDRISKYIASLKRNMKLNSQTLGYKWKIKEFLLEDPNYVKLKTELQRFMMREEQLDNILANAVEKGVRQFIEESQIVESNPEYKLIKIYKRKPKINKQNVMSRIQSENILHQINKENDQINAKLVQYPNIQNFTHESQKSHDLNYQSPRHNNKRSATQFSPVPFDSPFKKIPTKVEIETKAEQDFNSIKRQLQKSNERYIEMLSKINQSVEKGSQKLIQLREKRKKKLEKTQDIWGQLEKL